MKRGFVRQQDARKRTTRVLSPGRILHHGYRALTKRRLTPATRRKGANEPLFSDRQWSSNNRGLRSFRSMEEGDARRTKERGKSTLARSLALVLTAGIFRRQVFRKIYGEVTAWITMNSAHPPLSGLVIVRDPSAPQVLRA